MRLKSFGSRNLRFAKELLPALLLLVSAGAAGANVVYTAVGAGSSTASVGVIGISSAVSVDVRPSVLTGRPVDAAVYAFRRDGGQYVLVSHPDRTSGDAVYVYSAARGWNAPVASADWPGVRGVRDMDVSDNGRSLFAAAYDSGSVVEIRTETLLPTGNALTLSADGGSAHGQRIRVRGKEIYALLTAGNANGDNVSGWLFRLDGRLVPYASFDLGAGATDMAPYDDEKVLALAYGNGGGIKVYQPGRGKFKDLVNGSGGYGDIVSVCEDGGSSIYFIAQTASGADALYHWKDSAAAEVWRSADAPKDGLRRLVWDTSAKALAATTGDRVLIFKEDALVRTLTSGDLGGTVTSLATFNEVSDKDDGDSGFCSALGLGAVALFLPLALLRRRRA